MVVDKKGKMITARRYPVMVLIQPQMTSPGLLTLSHPDKVDSVTVDLEKLSGARVECEVWGEGCSGLDCGDEVRMAKAWIVYKLPHVYFHRWLLGLPPSSSKKTLQI